MSSTTRGPVTRRPRRHVPRHSTREPRPSWQLPEEFSEDGGHGLLASVLEALRGLDSDDRDAPSGPTVVDLQVHRAALHTS